MRYISLLSTLPLLVFAALAAAKPDPGQEVRFSLQLVEQRCVEPVAAEPACSQLLVQPETTSGNDATSELTEERTDFGGWQTLTAGSSGTLSSCSPGGATERWDVTFHEWKGNAAFFDFAYLRESGSEDDRSLETSLSTQAIMTVPGRQSFGGTIQMMVEGNQRIVTKSDVVLIAAPEPVP